MKLMYVLLAIFAVFPAAATAAGPDVEHFSANPDMQLPFSDAVRVGNMLYLSGKIGNVPGTRNLMGMASPAADAMIDAML